MSMVSVAENYMKRTQKTEVLQVDLLEYVVKKTGYSKESVRGTIIGYGKKLFGQDSFKKKWDICRRQGKTGARYVRKSENSVDTYEVSYDTPNKKEARERGLQCLSEKQSTVLTLASDEGHCVKYVLSKNPKNVIHNIERDPDVLTRWKDKGIDTMDFIGTVSKFIRTDLFLKTRYSVLNLDLMGYLCGSLYRDLQHLNTSGNWDSMALTIQGINGFRTHGEFKEWATWKYRRYADPTRRCIKECMSNYKLIDDWFYIRDPSQGCRPMRMLVFSK